MSLSPVVLVVPFVVVTIRRLAGQRGVGEDYGRTQAIIGEMTLRSVFVPGLHLTHLARISGNVKGGKHV